MECTRGGVCEGGRAVSTVPCCVFPRGFQLTLQLGGLFLCLCGELDPKRVRLCRKCRWGQHVRAGSGRALYAQQRRTLPSCAPPPPKRPACAPHHEAQRTGRGGRLLDILARAAVRARCIAGSNSATAQWRNGATAQVRPWPCLSRRRWPSLHRCRSSRWSAPCFGS